MAILRLFQLVLALVALGSWVVRIGTALAAYVGWVAADPLMRRRSGQAVGLIGIWLFVGIVVGVVLIILGADQLRPQVMGDATGMEPGVVVFVVTLVAASAAFAGPKLTLLTTRAWIVARGGQIPTTPAEVAPADDIGRPGPVILGGRIDTSSNIVAVEVPTGWIAIDRTFPRLWEHLQTVEVDAFRWADAGFDDSGVPRSEILIDAWETELSPLPPQRLRIVRIPCDLKDVSGLATRARARLDAGLGPPPIRIIRDRHVELPAGRATELSYVVRLAGGSSRGNERWITELHLLHDGWEYVLEFGGPTAAYNQRRSIWESFELLRT